MARTLSSGLRIFLGATAAIGAVFTFGFASPAGAATWQKIGQNASGTIAYVDGASVAVVGGVASAWVKTDLRAVQNADHAESVALYHINCAKQTSTRAAYTEYAADGSTIRSVDNLPQWIDNPIRPDSTLDIVARLVCK